MTDASQEHKYGSSQSLQMENASFTCNGDPLDADSSNVRCGPQSSDQQPDHRLHFSEKKQAHKTAPVFVAHGPIHHVQSRCRRCLLFISSSSGSSSADDQYCDHSRPFTAKRRVRQTAVVAANRPFQQFLSRDSSMSRSPQNCSCEDSDYVNSPDEDDDSPAVMAVGPDVNSAIEEDDARVLDNQPYSIDEHGDCQLPDTVSTYHAERLAVSGPNLPATEDTYSLPKYSSHVEKDYLCSSCKAILWPQSLQAYCGHRFCGKCRPQIEGGYCPLDGEEIPKGNIFIDVYCQREMLKHTVECGYGAELGCTWVGALESYEEHRAECREGVVACPKIALGCKTRVRRSEMMDHLLQQCRFYWRKCPFCEQSCTAHDIQAHLTSCQAATSSLHDGCTHKLERPPAGWQVDLEQKELMKCSFKPLFFEDTRSINGVLSWKIYSFSEAMENAITGEDPYLRSPLFFTSSYKMFARVYPNGDGVGKGSFLSVELVIKADDDCKLRWPFRQSITVTLLEHSPKAKNVTETLTPNIQSSSLPTINARQTMAVQFPRFASHTMLKQREFLKDNAMYIRIAVDLTGLPTS